MLLVSKKNFYGMVILFCIAASTGCTNLYKFTVQKTLGYRGPVGVHIERIRSGIPISLEQFNTIEPGESSLGDTLKTLGAPNKIIRTQTEEIIQYNYNYSRNSRFLLQPLFFLPYGNYASYNYLSNDKGPDVAAFVFDHKGQLKRKEFRNSSPDDSPKAVLKSVFVP